MIGNRAPSSATIEDLMALVNLVRNPDAALTMLSDLKSAVEEHHARLGEANERVSAVEVREATVVAAEIAATEQAAGARAMRAAALQVEANAKERDRDSQTRAAALEKAQDEFTQARLAAVQDLSARSADVTAREQAVAVKLEEAKALLAQYDADKHAAFKKIAGE